MKKFWLLIVITLLSSAIALPGCSGGAVVTEESGLIAPTPTSNVLFSGETGIFSADLENDGVTSAPTLSNLFLPRATQTPKPTLPPHPTVTSQPPVLPTVYADPFVDVLIYDDELDADWQIIEPSAMEFYLKATEQVYSGQYAIEAVPKGDLSTLLITLRPNAQANYPRSQVLAISFQLYSGEDFIKTDALAVAVVGSNSFPYYVKNDNSVLNNYDPVFSETRLYYLGVNRDIPPDTWVEVTVWLEDRIYDPNYRYVTGFYIKNAADFRQSFRIDDVRLILQPDS